MQRHKKKAQHGKGDSNKIILNLAFISSFYFTVFIFLKCVFLERFFRKNEFTEENDFFVIIIFFYIYLYNFFLYSFQIVGVSLRIDFWPLLILIKLIGIYNGLIAEQFEQPLNACRIIIISCSQLINLTCDIQGCPHVMLSDFFWPCLRLRKKNEFWLTYSLERF